VRDYQQDFLRFAVEHNALRFGSFVLKSGRESPYFFNAGAFHTGRDLEALGQFYADAILDAGLVFDTLFGPAYKGIPLVAATAMALSRKTGNPQPWCFDRKEAKAHGEGGSLVGSQLSGRVLIIDDVITAGTAIRHSIELIRANQATPVGVAVMMDRQERAADSTRSAIETLQDEEDLSVISIANLDQLVEFCAKDPEFVAQANAIKAYRAEYGTPT